jgi:hypothetical protein
VAERSASAVWLQAVSSEPSLRGTVTAAVSFVLTESAGPNAFSQIAHPGTTQGICDEFGTLKMRMGATHFLMKTLPRVATEMALHVLAYNLTRAMNIIGPGPLIAAIRT